ncbi:MAG: class I SAM-dependent RNA methyltransferase [Lachnospiraceae bacterium]|nr:class I SAM-dependent RNA methyltransferase [Lachnospiraceae bacterium]
MKTMDLIAPCHFGLEACLKREITDIGYDVTAVEDGRVTFAGDAEAVCRGNVFLRTAERILLKCGEFRATTFDELFEGTRKIPWADFLPEDARFWVTKASSVKSALFSPSDIQRIVKKAIVEKMKLSCPVEYFAEDGDDYPIRVFLNKDLVTIALETTGTSLHKRGYRKMTSQAPISETLAAALLMLTPWKGDRILVDPFCGSGTFPIEAALMAANIAPGVNRTFTSMNWDNLIPPSLWDDTIEEARDLETPDIETDIQGYDIDGEVLRAARQNAADAGVGHLIHFQQRPVAELAHPKKYGFVVTNPPYGERMEEREALPAIYRALGDRIKMLDSWSAYVISSYDRVERDMGMKAAKNRKIYNGMIKTYFYQFPGPKPGAKRQGF